MRRPLLLRAALVATLTASAHAGPLELTGTVSCGTYTRTNEDIYVYNATLVPGPGGATTLTLVTNNGKVVIGATPTGSATSGLDAGGADGADGWSFSPPQAGQPAGDGLNLTIVTNPPTIFSPSIRDCGVYIYRAVDCTGGDGGDGAPGANGYFDNCTYIDPDPGYTARPGGKGGAISITAAGPVTNSGGLLTLGGNGGWGGSGGIGIIGPGEDGREGGRGGDGGNISITQTTSASSTSEILLQSNATTSGVVQADGGHGGPGGAGGTGSGPHPGGNGGDGGDGGDITINGRNFRMTTSSGACFVSSRGGLGAAGGEGGDAFSSVCVPNTCDQNNDGIDDHTDYYLAGGYGGANSGSGGNGGAGGPVSVTSAKDLTMGLSCSLITDGGAGASPGEAGVGSVAKGDVCETDLDCVWYDYFGPGQTLPAGDGGAAGAIQVSTLTLTLASSGSGSASMNAEGGDGGLGIPGSSAGGYCCHRWWVSGQGGQGSEGGDGGAGAKINLTYTTYSVTGDPFFRCGGAGQQGGAGADGQPGGQGGVGGFWGASGTLYKNLVAQSDPCTPGSPVAGNDGSSNAGPCQ